MFRRWRSSGLDDSPAVDWSASAARRDERTSGPRFLNGVEQIGRQPLLHHVTGSAGLHGGIDELRVVVDGEEHDRGGRSLRAQLDATSRPEIPGIEMSSTMTSGRNAVAALSAEQAIRERPDHHAGRCQRVTYASKDVIDCRRREERASFVQTQNCLTDMPPCWELRIHGVSTADAAIVPAISQTVGGSPSTKSRANNGLGVLDHE